MSELTTGPGKSRWSSGIYMHNYCTGEDYYTGWAWDIDFNTKATLEDVAALFDAFGQVKIDIPTLFGKDSYYERHKDDGCYQPPTVYL